MYYSVLLSNLYKAIIVLYRCWLGYLYFGVKESFYFCSPPSPPSHNNILGVSVIFFFISSALTW